MERRMVVVQRLAVFASGRDVVKRKEPDRQEKRAGLKTGHYTGKRKARV